MKLLILTIILILYLEGDAYTEYILRLALIMYIAIYKNVAVGDSMFSRLVPRDAELVGKLALCSDPPVADLNVREQGDICGHMSTDISIVPDRVGDSMFSRPVLTFESECRYINDNHFPNGNHYEILNKLMLGINTIVTSIYILYPFSLNLNNEIIFKTISIFLYLILKYVGLSSFNKGKSTRLLRLVITDYIILYNICHSFQLINRSITYMYSSPSDVNIGNSIKTIGASLYSTQFESGDTFSLMTTFNYIDLILETTFILVFACYMFFENPIIISKYRNKRYKSEIINLYQLIDMLVFGSLLVVYYNRNLF